MRAAAEERASVPVEAPVESSGCGLFSCAVAAWATEGVDARGGVVAGVQPLWAARTVRERLRVLKAARHLMAGWAEEFAEAISPELARSKANTLAAELLPMLDACKFLEREAERLLRPRRLGVSGRPLWLGRVRAEIHREPVGHVLVIGPSNFPLLLAGVQALQALAAGNAVTWKPGVGGEKVAMVFARAMKAAGLPDGLLTVTEESVEAGQRALGAGPDKVVFTGSAGSGRRVLAGLAETGTPAVMELSGADAVMVMPSADLGVVAKAVAFGLRLNGAAVCMSPRRLFVRPTMVKTLRPMLEGELEKIPAVKLEARTAERLKAMLEEAVAEGAVVWGEFRAEAQRPLVVYGAKAGMAIARSDVFAPVISVLEAESMLHVLEQYGQCEYGLTAAIFCGKSEEKKARAFAASLKAGTVLINDLIAPTIDPRVPFGGRGASGFGVTRGAEGLLEMTAVKVLLVRRGVGVHLEAPKDDDAGMFAGWIGAVHGGGLGVRWRALRRAMGAARGRSEK